MNIVYNKHFLSISGVQTDVWYDPFNQIICQQNFSNRFVSFQCWSGDYLIAWWFLSPPFQVRGALNWMSIHLSVQTLLVQNTGTSLYQSETRLTECLTGMFNPEGDIDTLFGRAKVVIQHSVFVLREETRLTKPW